MLVFEPETLEEMAIDGINAKRGGLSDQLLAVETFIPLRQPFAKGENRRRRIAHPPQVVGGLVVPV